MGVDGSEIDGDEVIGELLADLELAYQEAEFATRHWSAAMQAGRYESAAEMIPEIRRAHGLVISRIRECRDVLKVQISEHHRRLREGIDSMDSGNTHGSPSSCGEVAAISVAATGIAAAVWLIIRGMTRGN